MSSAPHMTWHFSNRRNGGVLTHPSHGEAWKHFDVIQPTLQVSLGIWNLFFGGSSASATSTHTRPDTKEVVDLREQVQNLTQSLQTKGQTLQQHIDELRSLKDTLAERDARAEEQLRCMEEMLRQMAAYTIRHALGPTLLWGVQVL
ncbi:hypothetical protein PIB30_030242 [Stylosanthes scabra]|uniref:Uncharacterized protein n=1 Tax=Stylosanthes scabra TaxID=79078 RepID=A0ABU6WB88_9FABA|nr:hypothetical protein [Stylosanthes scabra]